jgi:hypothetical protein
MTGKNLFNALTRLYLTQNQNIDRIIIMNYKHKTKRAKG